MSNVGVGFDAPPSRGSPPSRHPTGYRYAGESARHECQEHLTLLASGVWSGWVADRPKPQRMTW